MIYNLKVKNLKHLVYYIPIIYFNNEKTSDGDGEWSWENCCETNDKAPQ